MKTVRSFVLLGVLALGLQAGQTPAKSSPPASPAPTQAERAEAAMEKSLEQQQSSLDSFGQNIDTSSIHQQQISLKQQSSVLGGQDKGTLTSLASPAEKQPAQPAANQVAGNSQNTFYTLPWPSPAPLAVPNVQMMDDTCQALGQNDVEQLIDGASKKHGVDVDLLRSVMRQESGFKPCAVSVAGAMGLMQIMPGTADMLKLDDPFDPAKNVDAGASFLKMMLDRYQGNVPLALGAYNAGPGNVDKAGGVPPIAETVQYITNILGDLSQAY